MSVKQTALFISAILIIFPMFTGLFFPRVDALSAEQRALYYSGVNWFDLSGASDFCDTGTGTTAGQINITGINNLEKAYNYFRARGLSAEHSAAIMGNFLVESWDTMNPAIKQGSKINGQIQTFSDISEVANDDGRKGYGLAQWTYPTRQDAWVKFTLDNGLDILQLESQLEWAWHEWGSNSNYGKEEFLDTTDLRQATWIFVAWYERPGAVSGYEKHIAQPTSGDAKDSLDARYQRAQTTLELFGDNEVSSFNTLDFCIGGTGDTDFSASGVRIDHSLPWIGKINVDPESNCTPAFTAGAQVLREFVLEVWRPPVTGVGGYDCRPIVGSSTLTSIHGMGRAIDIYINALDPAERAIGDEIRNWLINNSVAVGVQRVIWNRFSWNSEVDGWNDYCKGECTDEGGSKHPHENHLHVEINDDGATMSLPWYAGR